MSGFSQTSVSSQNSRGTKRKWLPEEYAALVACMVDLHNVGTFNADTRFKVDYLNELEKMLEKVLPNAKLKAKPNLESRIRTLKRDWSIVYDMVSGKNNSGFAADIIKEIDTEDVATTNTHEERNYFHGWEADVSLDDVDLSGTQQQPAINQEKIETVGVEISRSISSEVLIQQMSEMTIQESALKLYPTLCEVEGLTEDELFRSLSKIPDHPTQMLIFFSLPSSIRLEWVRRFLADH
ncbi:hypothetical protein CXB51_003042 [Gossypium anomalum]|uniref:Myb/SANT-like domain-containing protein n=1 Tax=Gossypium anomalum TaxID=47600 RepID=A0A8J5ZPA3_9ROSI|nr:hypothetical protein CXB51_003042 [Gossypium anomalum]